MLLLGFLLLSFFFIVHISRFIIVYHVSVGSIFFLLYISTTQFIAINFVCSFARTVCCLYEENGEMLLLCVDSSFFFSLFALLLFSIRIERTSFFFMIMNDYSSVVLFDCRAEEPFPFYVFFLPFRLFSRINCVCVFVQQRTTQQSIENSVAKH